MSSTCFRPIPSLLLLMFYNSSINRTFKHLRPILTFQLTLTTTTVDLDFSVKFNHFLRTVVQINHRSNCLTKSNSSQSLIVAAPFVLQFNQIIGNYCRVTFPSSFQPIFRVKDRRNV